jgi:hypothetical protein
MMIGQSILPCDIFFDRGRASGAFICPPKAQTQGLKAGAESCNICAVINLKLAWSVPYEPVEIIIPFLAAM